MRPPGPWVAGGAPWILSPAALPAGWPPEVAAVDVRQLAVAGASVRVQCAVQAKGPEGTRRSGGAAPVLACQCSAEEA